MTFARPKNSALSQMKKEVKKDPDDTIIFDNYKK